MSREYAQSRIEDALKQNKGNPTKARQRIIAWAAEDPKLLLALAQPHLKGIVAHAVNRVIYKQGLEEPETPETPQSLDMPPESFGKEILQALQGNGATMFGMDAYTSPTKRPQASKSHQDALNKIARKTPPKEKK
jgi:hypothetical protein